MLGKEAGVMDIRIRDIKDSTQEEITREGMWVGKWSR